MRAMKPCRLCTARDRVEADTILETLKLNGISSYKEGGIMDIYAGNSVFGEEIFVDEGDLEAAKEILTEMGLLAKEQESAPASPGKSKKVLCVTVAVFMILFMILLLVQYLYS